MNENILVVIRNLHDQYGVSYAFIAHEVGLSRQALNNCLHARLKMSDKTTLKVARFIIDRYGELLKKTERAGSDS